MQPWCIGTRSASGIPTDGHRGGPLLPCTGSHRMGCSHLVMTASTTKMVGDGSSYEPDGTGHPIAHHQAA
jgi:hypothetical protein